MPEYVIKHGDVFEILNEKGTCVNRTFALKVEIEGLYLQAGKKMKVRMFEVSDAKFELQAVDDFTDKMVEHLKWFHNCEIIEAVGSEGIVYKAIARKPKSNLFSGMCAEEIQEVADKLHGKDEYSKHKKMLLILIANLAARLKEKE